MSEEVKKGASDRKKKDDNQADIEAQVNQSYDKKVKELKELEVSKAENVKLICTVLDDLPYKSEKEETKLKFIVLFNEYLKRITLEKIDSELLNSIDKKYLGKLYDCLNKTFEFLSEMKEDNSTLKVNSTFLLKIHSKIFEKFGNYVLLQFLSAKKSLSVRVKYETKQK